MKGTAASQFAVCKTLSEAMFGNPQAIERMNEAERIAEKFERHLYEDSFVDEVS